MSFSYGVDVLRPAFPDRPIPYVSYGTHFPEACAHHVANTLSTLRVYILASHSLSTKTSALRRLQNALGPLVVGTRIGMRPHTMASEVVAIAADARPLKPDCIITLGGGSLTDASKVLAWMLANDTHDINNTTTSSECHRQIQTTTAPHTPPTIRVISIPTTLSGGEYQSIAGVTDDSSGEKRLFEPPTRNPSLVILDPDLSTTTPAGVWLSTGIRAVDHCVETLCSLVSNAPGDAAAAAGLTRLVPALLRCHRDPHDLDPRFEAMLGVIDAMSAVGSGVPLGASHAIGHQLGPLGVGHGETSCVMLPAVCKWNAMQGVNEERQEACKAVLMRDREVRSLIAKNWKGAGEEPDLGDVLDVVIRELGMPRTLKEVGVGRDKLDELAEKSLKDHWILTNPKPITEKVQVLEILEMVVE